MSLQLGTAQPHVAAYMIIRKNGKIAFVLRENTSWMKHHYGLPSGKVEREEAALAAAIREAKEEIGVTFDSQHAKHVLTMHRNEGSDWVDFFFEASEWQGEPHNAEPHMHSELAWLDPHNLPKNTIPSIHFAVERICNGHNYCEFGW